MRHEPKIAIDWASWDETFVTVTVSVPAWRAALDITTQKHDELAEITQAASDCLVFTLAIDCCDFVQASDVDIGSGSSRLIFLKTFHVHILEAFCG